MASQRPWIEINGVKSTTIAGLLITSVPPVAKPPKRYQLQAVDGLNGDIRTDLGYAAYDKTVGIGLAGTYNEDAVIAFFDQTGTVIFSNEPDKVYTFDAIEGFSMDRLARLRQGEVILHVQPFKTDADETPETITATAGTLTDVGAYISRPSPANASAVTENIIGGSFGWNQLIENGNFADGTDGWTKGSAMSSLTAAGGVLSFAYSQGSSNTNRYLASTAFSSIPTGTVVMMGFTLRRTGDNFNVNVALAASATMANTNRKILSNVPESFHRYGIILTTDTEAVTRLVFGTRSATTGVDASYELKDVVLYNLTAMFGKPAASAIAAMETAEEGAGVAFVRDLFGKDYYATNAGQVISVNASAHVMSGSGASVVYPLDASLTLRGVPTISNGAMSYDGDIYAPDGTVTRKFAEVDLGDLTWSYNTTNAYFLASGLSVPCKTITSGTITPEMVVSRGYAITSYAERADKTVGQVNNGNIFVVDSDYTTAADLKAALDGIVLVYWVETETTETAEAFAANQQVINGGEEAYEVTAQEGVDVPVGHDSTYTTASGSVTITNKGNRPSEPTLTITGSGSVGVYLDGVQYFTISFPSVKTITIDTHAQEAVWSDGTYANRAVTGEYSAFRIPPGAHVISISGGVTSASIDGVSLWT